MNLRVDQATPSHERQGRHSDDQRALLAWTRCGAGRGDDAQDEPNEGEDHRKEVAESHQSVPLPLVGVCPLVSRFLVEAMTAETTDERRALDILRTFGARLGPALVYLLVYRPSPF